MKLRPILSVFLLLGDVMAQFEEEEETYRGQLIGSLNSYHHQVSHYKTVTTNWTLSPGQWRCLRRG